MGSCYICRKWRQRQSQRQYFAFPSSNCKQQPDSCLGWYSIASIHMGQLPDRIDATNKLASLAQDNERNKKIIVEEGGIVSLLKLLKEPPSSEAQIAALRALYVLANNQDRVRNIAEELGVPIIVQVLGNPSMIVQILAARLVATMADHDPIIAEEYFARANAIRPLVTLLSFEIKTSMYVGKQSIHPIVQINKNLEKKFLGKTKEHSLNKDSHLNSDLLSYEDGSISAGRHCKEREDEKPEVKLQLKIACVEALWMLARGSVSNCRRITETKGLLCLAKMVGREEGELLHNCLMTIMEITAATEINADLRGAAFQRRSPAPKAVVDQMLRLIENSYNPTLVIPAIRSIGYLAKTSLARESRVIGSLVNQLNNRHLDVAAEAVISLKKFVYLENFLFVEHSTTMIEFNGIPILMKLLKKTFRHGEKTHIDGLILLCYLVCYAGKKIERLDQARVLTFLEELDRNSVAKHLRELIVRTIIHLKLYQDEAEVHSKRHLVPP